MKKQQLELLTALVGEMASENSVEEKTGKPQVDLAKIHSALFSLYLNARAATYRYIELYDSIKGPQEFDDEFITPLSSFWQFTEALLEVILGHTPSEEELVDFKSEILEAENDVVDRWFEFHG